MLRLILSDQGTQALSAMNLAACVANEWIEGCIPDRLLPAIPTGALGIHKFQQLLLNDTLP